MIDVAEHLQRVLDTVPRTPTSQHPLEHAAGLVLADTVRARVNLPPWDNSAMDGFAVRVADTLTASPEAPVTLTVVGEVAAGSAEQPSLAPTQAVSIMTGAPLPADADAVVPIEDVLGWDPMAPTAGQSAPATIQLTAPVVSGRHIRRRAEDVKIDDTVLEPGVLLGAAQLGSAAASGAGLVTVADSPTVVIVATGDELVSPQELADPETTLIRGQIPESNSYLLAELVRQAGATVTVRRTVSDDPAELEHLLAETAGHSDAVILTGGASVGAHDVSRLVLAPDSPGGGGSPSTAGTTEHQVEFVKVRMQPGKPQGFGVLADGRPIWVLPGNPVSVLVSALLFVQPGLRAMQGLAEPRPPWRTAVAATGWTPSRGRDQYIPVRTVSPPSSPEQIAPAHARGSGSHYAARLGVATGLAHVPADHGEVHPGDVLRYFSF